MEPGQMTSASTSYIKILTEKKTTIVKVSMIRYSYCQFWLVQHANYIWCLGSSRIFTLT